MMKIIINIFLLLISASCVGQQKELTSFADATKFFMKRLQFPQDAIDSNHTGLVMVSLLIKDGEVKSIQTVFKANGLLENDVRRVVTLSSKLWKFIERETVVIIPVLFSISKTGFVPFNISGDPALLIRPEQGVGSVVLQTIPVVCWFSHN